LPLSRMERRQLGAWHELAAYESVAEGVPLLVRLLGDADAEVAGQAIYALAWFPEHTAVILPGLVRVASNAQRSVELASAALIALGLLAPRHTHDFDELLSARLGAAEPHLRCSAAVAWAHIAGDSMPEAALAELRTWATRYGDDSPKTIWEVGYPTLALTTLDHVAAPIADEIRTGLVAAELAKPPKSNWHNHFNVVLDRAFPTMNPDHGLSFDQLSSAQQTVVLWLIENPHVFGPSGPGFPLKQRGLPTTLARLRTYAGRGGADEP
jgi:hypothetical protein